MASLFVRVSDNDEDDYDNNAHHSETPTMC